VAWFCYEISFSGQLQPRVYNEKPDERTAEGRKRSIVKDSLYEIDSGLSTEQAEIAFLLSRGGKFTYKKERQDA